MDGSSLPCKVQFQTGTVVDGRALTFTNVRALGGATFNDFAGFPCPKQSCNVQMDIILIVDESGSIDAAEFSAQRQFILGIANSYNIAPNAISMGLVMFATNSRTILNYSNNKQTVINAINGVIQATGSTCIGCGFRSANTMAQLARPGVQKVYILLTDGYNNQNVDLLPPQVTIAKDTHKAIIFCIGVDGYDQQQLDYIKSDLPGVQTVYTVSQFSQLNTILANLTAATCLDIPGTPCGKACQGFCGCKQTCYCPSACTDNNQCTNDVCVPGQNGNGCQFTNRTCDDNDKCTNDGCDPATGCTTSAVTCDDNNACTVNECDSVVGCRYPSIAPCADSDPCTRDYCVPATGCRFDPVTPCNCSAVTCPPAAPCTRVVCDPNTGTCPSQPVTCDDGNACTNDFCDPALGTNGDCNSTPIPACNDNDACTHDSCDPTNGCQFKPFVIAVDCDDKNNCTVDSCNPTRGCVHTPITCDDGDLCTNDGCSSFVGCTYVPVECPASGDCSIAQCNPVSGCYLEAIPGRNLDKCGVCDGDGSTCGETLSTAAVAGLSAGILAVIIIAAVAVCVALGIFGGKKGYDIWMRNQGGMGGAHKNPLYKDHGLSGTNPLHEAK
jgi:hypothetical protein